MGARIAFLLGLALLCTGCASYLPFVAKPVSSVRFFKTEFATAWTAAVESVASTAGDIAVEQNQEQGVIKTGWIDNSKEWSFFEVFKDDDIYLRSRYRLHVLVQPGRKYAQDGVIMVRIHREHQVEKTFLGGWQTVETNGRVEKTLLYRIGRLVALREFQDKLDERKAKKIKIDF